MPRSNSPPISVTDAFSDSFSFVWSVSLTNNRENLTPASAPTNASPFHRPAGVAFSIVNEQLCDWPSETPKTPTICSLKLLASFKSTSVPSLPYPSETPPCRLLVSACVTSAATFERAPAITDNCTLCCGDSACTNDATARP